MVISAECMVAQTNACLTTAVDMLPVSQLVGVNCNLNQVPYAVACVALLPDAACNMGRFVYVTNIGSYRFSDGVSWTRNFVGSVPIANLFVWQAFTQLVPTVVAPNGYEQSWCTVSTGGGQRGAIKTNGTLWMWGGGGSGELGTGNTVTQSLPVTTAGGGNTWCQINAGNSHTGAVKTDGTLWMWGLNSYGRLGDNSVNNRSSPVTTVGGGTNWCTISTLCCHSAAIKTDGTLWTWGANAQGQLGNSTAIDISSPGTTAGGGTTWCAVGTGASHHTAAVKTDGTLWTWGRANYGQLGDNTTTSRSSPGTTVGGGTNWRVVNTSNFTGAIKTDGTLWTWGVNGGRLGDGTTVGRSSPGTTAGGGTNWCLISTGNNSAAAIKTDGTLWTWGTNQGRLGNGIYSGNTSSPGTVAGGITTWCMVSMGSSSSTALTAPP